MYIPSPAAQFLVIIVAIAVFHAIMLAIAGFAFAEFLLLFSLLYLPVRSLSIGLGLHRTKLA